MPYPRFPRCFLSCSFEADDKPVFEWFRTLLEALEFDVVTGEEPTTRPLPDMIRERIRESHAFVAILTKRDKVEGTAEWLPPTWVRDETVLAYSMDKPVAILAEEGVRVDGIVPQKSKFERWNRADLGAVAPIAVRFFVVVRNEISPAVDDSGELATIRALAEELSGIGASLDTAEETLELGGFHLAYISARFTGRLFTLPERLKDKVVEAYAAAQKVEGVVNRISDERWKATSLLKSAVTGGRPTTPPLPESSPLRIELHDAVKHAAEKVWDAGRALFKAGYPQEWEKIRQKLNEVPPSPETDEVREFLTKLLGLDQ